MRNQNNGITVLRRFFILTTCILLITAAWGCSPSSPKEKPLSLGYFTEIAGPSISPDGNQVLFTGCGHPEFKACTIYRFERDTGKLYRYLPRSNAEVLDDGHFSPTSTRFVFTITPLDAKNEELYYDTKIAIADKDGNGFRILTKSKSLMLNPALSYDEKSLVFYKGRISNGGSPLRKQKTRILGMDLYRVDTQTGDETQLTRLAFYGVSYPYVTPDGKNVVFAGDSPMALPRPSSITAAQFRENYKNKYKENIILRYPLDGSEVDKEPVPLFIFDNGAENPTVAKDGSIWFEGMVGIQHFSIIIEDPQMAPLRN